MAPTLPPSTPIRSAALLALVSGLTLCLGFAAPARAESLDQALASTYRYNPRIDAERARLRATDEEVARAQSGYRPDIRADADINVDTTRTDPDNSQFGQGGTNNDTLYPSGYSFNLTQNVFDGFQTTNAVRESEAAVRAGRESLRVVEQTVLLQAVTAYMDVVRDQAIVRLRENNVTVLSRELKATQDRFKVGEVTRTDVAQAQARRAATVSDLDLARANLKTSRGVYEQIVGNPPSSLSEARARRDLEPNSLDEAIAIASNESPSVVGALYREMSSRHTVDRIRGELLPRAQLEASYSERFDGSERTERLENTTVTGRLTIPIYQDGGEVYARVRQAKHTHVSLLQEIEQFRAEAQAFVVQAWSQLHAARARLESDEVQVTANRTALAGVREEERVGQRTLLDVLDAEQELLDAEVRLVRTRRDVVVSSYLLLSAIGRLDMSKIGVADNIYDPEVNYFDTRRRWFGLSITHANGRVEHVDAWRTHVEPYK